MWESLEKPVSSSILLVTNHLLNAYCVHGAALDAEHAVMKKRHLAPGLRGHSLSAHRFAHLIILLKESAPGCVHLTFSPVKVGIIPVFTIEVVITLR